MHQRGGEDEMDVDVGLILFSRRGGITPHFDMSLSEGSIRNMFYGRTPDDLTGWLSYLLQSNLLYFILELCINSHGKSPNTIDLA